MSNLLKDGVYHTGKEENFDHLMKRIEREQPETKWRDGEEMKQKKLREILEKHRLWLEGNEEGERANLRGANLRDVDLRYVNLREADLRGADLREADLRDVNLREADLREADLRDVNLRDVNLRYVDLRGANLRYVNLRDVDLRDVNLREADLRGADLREADLRDVNLRGANLREANVDFSVWPLWCGSLDVNVDARIARQLAYHLCRLECDDEEYLKVREAIKDFANKFHRAEECGELRAKTAPSGGNPAVRENRTTEPVGEVDTLPFGACQCGYEFNSELINEYSINYCPSCGRKL